MNLLKTRLIDILTLAAIATTGTSAAETDKQGPTPESRMENSPAPAELTATRCLICHGNSNSGQGRLAPPFAMVKMHYQSLGEEAFIKAVSSWVKQPDKHKSKMPGAINRFGMMPTLGYPEAEVTAIAKYIYQTDFSMPGHGGGGMGGGAGNDFNPSEITGSNDEEGCDEGCEMGKAGVPKAAESCCNACETDKSDARIPAAEPVEKATPTSSPAPKWPIPAAMMIHLLDMERDITAFEGKAAAEHADLAASMDENLQQLISSCTMDGEAHNALHDWLVPFRELAKQQAESADPAVQSECVREMHRAFATFHEQFVSAPRP